jgi:hypothetical protein
VSGSWATTLVQSAITGDLTGNVTGDLTGNVTGNVSGTAPAGTLTGTTLAAGVVTSSLTAVGALGSGSISSGFGAIDNGVDTIKGGARTIASSNGGMLTFGIISEETTLSTVALTTNGATQIPANSRVIAATCRVTEVIDTATAIEIGITAVDTNGYIETLAVAAGTTGSVQGALNFLNTPRTAATTYTILANGQNTATGKVRTQIYYCTITAPTS